MIGTRWIVNRFLARWLQHCIDQAKRWDPAVDETYGVENARRAHYTALRWESYAEGARAAIDWLFAGRPDA